MNPHTKGPLSFSSMLCAVVFSLFLINFSEAEERSPIEITRSQIQQIEKELLEQRGELLSVDIKEKDILEEIERLEKDVAANRESLRGLSSQIRKISQEVQGAHGRIEELNRSSRAVKECLKNRLVAFYKFGRPGYVRLLAPCVNLQEFQKIIKYMKAVMDQDTRILDMLGGQRSRIERELEVLEENMATIERLKKTRDTKMALLEKGIEKKVFLLMKVHREKEFYAKAVEELKEAAQALNQTVVDLEMEEREGLLAKGFAEMKGKLPLPIKGKILREVKQFGSTPFVHRKGIYIKACAGDEIRSIFPGRIDYSGWFKGYGQLMIINHGSHYFTIFAHLEERAKGEGEMVSGGEVVGLAGDLGWHVGPGIYFEIRRGGDYLDPERWLKTEQD
jgi:septal ring factor EnvC (AmiA/AmiB activator)